MMILIPIFQGFLYKIAKASSKRVPGLGTSTGHKLIIDQSYRAPIFFVVQSSSGSIRQWASRACTMDLRGSYERTTGQVKGGLHQQNFEILAKLRFEYMVLQSKTRGISWAERGSHRIEKIMVYDRKTEIIKNVQKMFFFISVRASPRTPGDPIKPYKTQKIAKTFFFLPFPPGVS